MKIRLVEEAAAELIEAREWHRLGRSPMRARQFADAASAAINRLGSFPQSGRAESDVRIAVVTGHPYQVVYRVVDNEVEVIAFAHTSREPGYWRYRL